MVQYLSASALQARLAQHCEAHGGRSEWARRHGIPASVVTDTIAGRRGPSDTVLAAMGLMKVEGYLEIKRGNNGL